MLSFFAMIGIMIKMKTMVNIIFSVHFLFFKT